MLDTLRKLLAGAAANASSGASELAPPRVDDVRVAACALLVELASVDGDFSALERERILNILQRHFGVDASGAEALIAEATRASRGAVDDFVFTRRVVGDYDLAQRMVFAELMWQVVLADGEIAGDESYLMRKLANLLQLEPAFLSEARQRVERLDEQG